MLKITILRKQLPNGCLWWIKNWDDYITYLEQNSLPKPIIPYKIFAELTIEQDFRHYYGDFEEHIPLIFQLEGRQVQYEIIDE